MTERAVTRLLVMAGGLTVALALAAGCTTYPSRGPHGARPTSGDVGVGVTHAPVGGQLVSYHGITVTVPRSFGVGPVICSLPSMNWVAPYTGEAASCPAQTTPRVDPRAPHASGPPPNTFVSLAPYTEPDAAFSGAQPVLVDGKAGMRGHRAGTGGGWPASYLALADPGVAVTVTGPDAALAATILDSVRVTPIDRYGCRDHVAGFTPRGNVAAASMLPDGAAGGDVCEYAPGLGGGTNWLIGSAALTPTELHQLTTLIATHPGSTAAHPPTLPNPPTPFAWYLLNHPDLPRRTIAATLEVLPGTLSDGTRTASMDPSGVTPTDLLPTAFTQ